MDGFDPLGMVGYQLIEPKLKYSNVLSVPNVGGAAIGGAHPSTVTPASGGPDTVFTYDVMYQNSVAPTIHNLVIDGTTIIPMSFKKTVGKMQEWEAASKLAPGPHTYTFQFGDGISTRRPTSPRERATSSCSLTTAAGCARSRSTASTSRRSSCRTPR
jgi:hypothetical protein